MEVNGNVPDAAALQQVKEDDNLFSFQEMFPGGFTPRFGADTFDHSVLAGLRGELPQGLSWEVSGYQGRHESDFFIFNTVNASLGPETPTSFDPGAYIQTDLSVNLDLAYPVSEPLYLAAGLEYRVEEFEIVQGEGSVVRRRTVGATGFQLRLKRIPRLQRHRRRRLGPQQCGGVCGGGGAPRRRRC